MFAKKKILFMGQRGYIYLKVCLKDSCIQKEDIFFFLIFLVFPVWGHCASYRHGVLFGLFVLTLPCLWLPPLWRHVSPPFFYK